jgi:DNA polymerase-3 subunit delta'
MMEPAVAQLERDIESGQVAQTYLLAGPQTAVKTKAANSFAQALLCTEPAGGEPCGSCLSCRNWEHGVHPDFHSLEAEGGSLKLEQVKSWRPFFNYRPQLGRHQIFYLLAPELLTPEAANSLLKVLEEPVPQTVFLLVTEDESALMPTIVSRCRVVLFHREAAADAAESEPEYGPELRRMLYAGREAELLRWVRRGKYDREQGRRLLRWLLSDLETGYRDQRRSMAGGEGGNWSLLPALETVLHGLELIDHNVHVHLLLALTLRRVQQQLSGWESSDMPV